MYIGGQFPRTESGRYYQPVNSKRQKLANVRLCSRKDFRDAVVTVWSAFYGWSSRAAFNQRTNSLPHGGDAGRRKAQFIEELMLQDVSRAKAEKGSEPVD